MTPEDLDTMARTVWGEARGEPLAGKIGVAWAIKNRADHPGWWGDSIFSVCKTPFQFSCWNANDPNRSKVICVHAQDEMFKECLMVTAAVLSGNFPDPTFGATHYARKTINPQWSIGKNPCVTLGNHNFYNDVK